VPPTSMTRTFGESSARNHLDFNGEGNTITAISPILLIVKSSRRKASMIRTQTLQQFTKSMKREAHQAVAKQNLSTILEQIERLCAEKLAKLDKRRLPAHISPHAKLIVGSAISLFTEGCKASTWDEERLVNFALHLRCTNQLAGLGLRYLYMTSQCEADCAEEWARCLRRIDCDPDKIFRLCGITCDLNQLGCNLECLGRFIIGPGTSL